MCTELVDPSSPLFSGFRSIHLKYPEVGHTFLIICDRIFSTIERKAKQIRIYGPKDWWIHRRGEIDKDSAGSEARPPNTVHPAPGALRSSGSRDVLRVVDADLLGLSLDRGEYAVADEERVADLWVLQVDRPEAAEQRTAGILDPPARLSPWPTDASCDTTSPTAWFGTQLPLLDVLLALMVLVSAVHSVVNTASGGPRQMKLSAPPKVTRRARMGDSATRKAQRGARKQATCRPPWRP
ncbi:unnamed protein product (mitochondrion) [Plasmodiophora brassicae]|uniref:Uncharacterized protein n=1 Tax=Plasmodiophora brassicae TaxID=37360 RepID=A0A3P3YLF3_PLABS|nr:unnamed protein product [Plasmodiophora brassicae]